MSTPLRLPSCVRALRPDEQALLNELIRARQVADGVQIEVAVISWPQCHQPQLDWLAVTLLAAGSRDADIYRARRRVLMQRRFFGLCKTCGQRHARGHMLNRQLCTGCAEQHHHMIF